MTAHARCSASSAERFMECPGSLLLSELLPAQEESEFAAEGTAAHALAERCLKEGVEAWMKVGEDLGNGYVATPEMARHVQVYLDAVMFEVVEGVTLLVEHNVDDADIPGFGGTADAVLHCLTDPDADGNCGFVHIIDLKYGAGLPVEVWDNAQLRYYAYGVLRSLGFVIGDNRKAHVGMTIVQPRAEHSDGPVRTVWEYSTDLMRWGEERLLPAIRTAQADSAEYKTGEHCRWCPAKLICPNLTKEFDDMAADPKHLENFSNEKLAEQYEKIAAVKMYLRALEAEAFNRAMKGDAIPGTKLIYGRSTRLWKEGAESVACAMFGEDAYTDPSLKSPAQIEKLPNGKDFAGEWSYKQEGNPSLVPSDKRGTPFDPAQEGAGFAALDTSETAD